MSDDKLKSRLLHKLMPAQADAVRSAKRRVLVVAGAGSGKTEIMARRIAWWVGVEKVPKEKIVAFTFTKKAAEEMKFRVRRWIGEITPPGKEINLGGMYVGTIHGFCMAKTREYWADEYHNYDILDEASRAAFILRAFNGLLGLSALRSALRSASDKNVSQSETLDQFILAYDQLHEHNKFEVKLPTNSPPYRLGPDESEWCKAASLLTDVGDDDVSWAFSISAARYYSYLRCRRFLDFSTSQTELLRKLKNDKTHLNSLQKQQIHLVVDEVQDINPIQSEIINTLIGKSGKLTVVGDHRQSIYGFRGAKVEIIGEMWNNFKNANDSVVVDLQHNFRSTPRIIEIANRWAGTINPAGGMDTTDMLHGKKDRIDTHPSHVAVVNFTTREDEANWIASAVRAVVPSETEGAEHDRRDGSMRGLALSDIAVLVRSSTDVRTYMRVLEDFGIPSIVRAGPDLFSQPEVLLFLGALAISAGVNEFYGSPHNSKSLPNRIQNVLSCIPDSENTFRYSARLLRRSGLAFDGKVEERLYNAAKALKSKILDEHVFTDDNVQGFRTKRLREFLTNRNPLRRVFPQQLYHWLLSEAETEHWDTCAGRGETAMFHLGSLSGLITGIETPGWTSAKDYKWQIIGLCQYGSQEGRIPEQPLMVKPDAVTISTVHSVKGLEFAAIFLADVCPLRFPSSYAKRKANVPLSGNILTEIDIDGLSDNENNDSERRLMYVALTRAERFLVVSRSGKKTSKFIKELKEIVKSAGGTVTEDSEALLNEIRHAPLENKRDFQLATSFSDLRYYLGCPHDFYLRKVLGFAPTIDQAFGYGRGVHNLMRTIHTDPKHWASLAKDRSALEAALGDLIERGLFYLRYTTGEPADNMRRKGVKIVADYVNYFADELGDLTFEPEKEFETLVEYDNGEGSAMISGAIDIVRRDDPPQVTLIDFKSGDPDSDLHQNLDEDEMRLQVGIYAVAAKKELEYEPERGLVRYLDVDRKKNEKHQLEVPLDAKSVEEAKSTVVKTATAIRDRKFALPPKKPSPDGKLRCSHCDFLGFCGMQTALKFKHRH